MVIELKYKTAIVSTNLNPSNLFAFITAAALVLELVWLLKNVLDGLGSEFDDWEAVTGAGGTLLLTLLFVAAAAVVISGVVVRPFNHV